MQLVDMIELMTNDNMNDRGNLCISLKHGEIISMFNGLIEIEVDLRYNKSKNKILLRIRSPKIFRVMRNKNN